MTQHTTTNLKNIKPEKLTQERIRQLPKAIQRTAIKMWQEWKTKTLKLQKKESKAERAKELKALKNKLKAQRYYHKNKQEIKEKRRKFYNENKTEILKKRKRYYMQHAPKIREKRRQKYQAIKEAETEIQQYAETFNLTNRLFFIIFATIMITTILKIFKEVKTE